MSSSDIIYTEPTLPQLLTVASFLYLLQVSRWLADFIFSAGLIGEIALGIIYGSPLAGILDESWEKTWLVVGYWGLVLIVFEGGLDFTPQLFIPSLPLATAAAFTGVLLPIAFSFAILSAAFGYPQLHAFSCGAALASTSLGTTFFVLRSQTSKFDLGAVRLGSVLTGAALIDDIIALVLLSVITALGEGNNTNIGWTIGHPIVASISLAVISPAVTYFIARPVYRRFVERFIVRIGPNAFMFVGMCALCAHLAIASYIGTTVLLGAFLAGVMLAVLPSSPDSETYISIFKIFVGPVQEYIFAPLFFSSIGYSIPFLDLFTARRFWQGFVFSIFMALGKLLVGVWIPVSEIRLRRVPVVAPEDANGLHEHAGREEPTTTKVNPDRKKRARWSVIWPSKASVAPAIMLGAAMVARGEIGILILQVAYASSLNSSSASSTTVISQDVYLIGVWAVMICTIVGPVAFSFVLKHCVSDPRRLGALVGSRWGQGAEQSTVKRDDCAAAGNDSA